MSRIGNAPVVIPQGVEIKVDGSVVTVKGKGGELKQKIDKDLTVKIEEGEVLVSRPTDQKRHKALHGLSRSLIFNMVEGVTNGYKLELELVGVGFRASSQGQLLEMALGYSHPVYFLIPDEVKVTTVSDKGKAPKVFLESIDKQLIGQVAARIRAIRRPEPYKGKGVKFVGEELRRKEGKSAKK